MEYTELRKKGVYLGRAGEDGKRTVWLDVTAWNEQAGGGSGVLLYTSPKGQVWPLGTKTETDETTGTVKLSAPITLAETAAAGIGHIEAQWMSGGEKVKSQTFNTMVLESAYTGETVPDKAPHWVQELIEELNAAGMLLEELGEVASEAHGAYEEIRGTSALIEQALNTAEQTVAQAEEYAEAAEGHAANADNYKTAAAASATAAAASAEQAMDATPAGYAAFVGSMAPAYSAASGYAVGDMVLKDGQLYKCNTAIDEEGETWTAAHWTAVTAAGQLSQLSEEIADAKSTIVNTENSVKPVNLCDQSDTDFVENYYINPSTGDLVGSTSYITTGYIPVSPGDEIRLKRYLSTGNPHEPDPTENKMRFIAAFDGQKNILSGSGTSSNTASYTVPSGVRYIRISSSKNVNYSRYLVYKAIQDFSGTPQYSEYFKEYSKDANTNKKYRERRTDSLQAGSTLTLGFDMNSKKSRVYEVFLNFSSPFSGIKIMHGGTGLYDSYYLKVLPTSVKDYKYESAEETQVGAWSHGLTIGNFLYVQIIIPEFNPSKARVRLVTSSGEKVITGVSWTASRGQINVKVDQDSTNVVLKYCENDLGKDVYVFGDSYVSAGYAKRWPTQALLNGFAEFALFGFPGADSREMYNCFVKEIGAKCPNVVVWTLGMNDPDTEDTINSNWLEIVKQVKAFCEMNGIELILATIPNTPTVRHIEKNNYVRTSGNRYVDFAKAVNADYANSTWYAGMLSGDNVHPDTLGAMALASQFLLDVPEACVQSKEDYKYTEE